jgi:hypothetical protein
MQRRTIKEFERTTRTWDHKPKFEATRDLSSSSAVSIYVGTNDRVWNWVDEGTAKNGPYLILPRKPGGRLAYQSEFSPKTSPGVLDSVAGGKSGDVVVRPFVIHPGVRARNFSVQIAREMEPKFKRELEDVMRDFATSSGHKVGI